MTLFDIFFLALALAVDAFVVSFSYGLIIRKARSKASLKLAFAVGLGQFLMPILGWYGAKSIYYLIEQVDHWIAFAVFAALGIKVVVDSFKSTGTPEKPIAKLTLKVLFIIGIATSIDAFVSGSMLYFVQAPILGSATIIGVTTFICSLMGFNLCKLFKKLKTAYLERTAGVILILLGCKVLLEHLS